MSSAGSEIHAVGSPIHRRYQTVGAGTPLASRHTTVIPDNEALPKVWNKIVNICQLIYVYIHMFLFSPTATISTYAFHFYIRRHIGRPSAENGQHITDRIGILIARHSRQVKFFYVLRVILNRRNRHLSALNKILLISYF